LPGCLAAAVLLVFASVLLACGKDDKDGGDRPAAATLDLTDGKGEVATSACNVSARFESYEVGSRVRFKGQISRGKDPVSVVIRRCLRGHFVVVKRIVVRPDSSGRFRGSFEVKERSDCYARAVVARGAVTPRRYFVVRDL
jgi:hypothetical protein